LTNNAAVADRNLATEKVIGESSRSIMNRVRRTSGVERVRIGCMSECSTVGRIRTGGQKYEGRVRKVDSVRRGLREVGVITSLEQ
jgi:hypothetical protein